MILHRITRIDIVAPQTLMVEFDDGLRSTHNFGEEIRRFPASPIIAALADNTVFASARIVRSDRSLEWANGYDLCADQCREWLTKTESVTAPVQERVESSFAV